MSLIKRYYENKFNDLAYEMTDNGLLTYFEEKQHNDQWHNDQPYFDKAMDLAYEWLWKKCSDLSTTINSYINAHLVEDDELEQTLLCGMIQRFINDYESEVC